MFKLIVIFLIMLLIYKYNKNFENFISLDKLLLDIKPKTNLSKLDILNNATDMTKNANISIGGSQVDDKILTEFINKQLGKEDAPEPNSYDTKSNMLVYPTPIEKKKNNNSKKIDYEDIIEKKTSEIKSKRLKQNVILRNIKHELTKLVNYQKPISELKKNYKKISNN